MNIEETRTIQLKLMEAPEKDFDATVTAYRSALNMVSKYVFETKITNPLKLQRELYEKVRAKTKIKSQMTLNCFRQVSGAYRTAKKNGYKWEEPINFTRNSVLLDYPRDFKFNSDEELSINTLGKRKQVRFVCGDHQREYIDNGWKRRSGRLVKRGDGWYFHVSVSKEFEVPEIDDRVTVIGCDLGINNIAVAYNGEGKVLMAKGGEVKNKKRHYEHVRSSLQSKGTQSAKRVLRDVSGRETRFMTDVNHQVSKQIVHWVAGFEKPVIALEDLRGIRRRVGTRKNKKSNKGSRRAINKWSYYQLRTFIEYKAHELGIPVIYVDPAYTSQHCPRCGHTEEGNRVGRNFKCLVCKYQNNADVVGAVNIRTKATFLRQDLEKAGCQSTSPEVPSDDAEAGSTRIDAEGRNKPLP